MNDSKIGFAAIIAACVIWGLSPLYYKLLTHVPATEIFLHRTVWSLVLFSGLLLVQGRLGALRQAFSSKRAAAITLFSAAMVSINWFLFIWAVLTDRTTETSLGYYILPLVAVLLGVLWLGERLSPVQWLAFALAAVGVVVMAVGQGVTPWLSLTLATSFALYGLVKKGLSLGPVVSVTAECTVLAVPSLIGLIYFEAAGQGHFISDPLTSLLLVFSGVVTALPLILFSRAAKSVRLSTMGLVQYLNPTLQFFCAVVIFAEPFTRTHAITFGCIWTALLLYSGAAVRQERARRRIATTSSVERPL